MDHVLDILKQLLTDLPGFLDDGSQATNHTSMVSGLWVNSWIVLLATSNLTRLFFEKSMLVL